MGIEHADPAGVASEELRRRVESVEAMIHAIRENQIDALVIGADGRERIRTLGGADEAYRVFVEAMGEGAVNVALDGTILYCNSHFAELLGTPVNETIGFSIFSFVEPSDEGALRALMWEGATQDCVRGDFNFRTATGKTVPVLVTATPLHIESVQSVCLLVTDLQDHAARVAAEAASQAKDRFIASLSHELRTPLTPAMMLLTSVMDDPRLAPELRDDLQIVRQNLELEARLIDDLLDLGHIIAGKLRINPVAISAHELIHRAVGMVETDAAQKRVTLELALEASSDRIVADQARVLQALWNVLKNAIKFSHTGGTVRVRSCNRDGCWVLDIIDDGIGISEQLLPRLFDAFEQGASNISRQYGGMGLGLAISKAVVELHHGSICAHSDGAGKGAVFTISLPLQVNHDRGE